ncbi:hypothetical protein HMI54_014019 [Coelomomyces lativittatus]|nr:hypothetical protein HMI56_005960 [Coelomomyces lativittatus]KAJ1496954.1 hypothetical protein HMI54_014019 [Coelomomyces lativittatus]
MDFLTSSSLRFPFHFLGPFVFIYIVTLLCSSTVHASFSFGNTSTSHVNPYFTSFTPLSINHPHAPPPPCSWTLQTPPPVCPPCFNCFLPGFSCKNFGFCNNATGRCSCPSGLGGEDCSKACRFNFI